MSPLGNPTADGGWVVEKVKPEALVLFIWGGRRVAVSWRSAVSQDGTAVGRRRAAKPEVGARRN